MGQYEHGSFGMMRSEWGYLIGHSTSFGILAETMLGQDEMVGCYVVPL
jgi:hypothetical protein